MTNVLIRNVPEEDMELLRAEAAERQQSLQAFMLSVLRERVRAGHNRAVWDRVERRLANGGGGTFTNDELLAAIHEGRRDLSAGLS